MSTINVKLRIPRPAVTCPTSIDDLIHMLESASITFPGSVPNFGPVEPGEDLRNAAWIKTDSNRNPLGTYTFSATYGKWVRDWALPVGELRTVVTSAANVQADREDKDLVDGWELADGSGTSGLDLRKNPAFFQGADPDYEYYTVLFQGYGDVVPVPAEPPPVSQPFELCLITLKRTPQRMEMAMKNMRRVKRQVHVIWATDGMDFETASTLPRDPRTKHLMQPGEVGLSMSWWRACAMIVRNDWKGALVLEDDATPTKSWTLCFAALNELPANFHVALLHNQHVPEPLVASEGPHTKTFKKVVNSSWTTSAIAISNEGARRMLKELPPFDRPIDVFIRDNESGLTVYQPREGMGFFEQNCWAPSTVRENFDAGKIPKLIHRIWVGGAPMPPEFEYYWATWAKHHPDYRRKTWDDARIDAEWPDHAALKKAETPAAKSDLARLLILEKFGGLYVDTDFECFQSFTPLLEASSLLVPDMHMDIPCNGLLGATAGQHILRKMLDTSINGTLQGKPILQAAGPAMVKEVIDQWRKYGWQKPLMFGGKQAAVAFSDTGLTVIDPWVCFPYYWTQEKPESYGNAWAAHHWARSWWGPKEWSTFENQMAIQDRKQGTAA